MDACRELEQKYGLVPADQKKREVGLPLKPVRYEDGDVKHQISNVIRPLAGAWHFQSFKEYRALLTLYNIGVEEVRGEVKGKPYRGLVYSALDGKGEKVGILEMRRHFSSYFKGLPNFKETRLKLVTLKDIPELLATIDSIADRWGDFDTSAITPPPLSHGI